MLRICKSHKSHLFLYQMFFLSKTFWVGAKFKFLFKRLYLKFCCLNLLHALLGQIEVQLSLLLFSVVHQSMHGFFYKSITVKRLMFSCWSLFNTEAMFSFFELPFGLLVEFSLVFTAVCSTGVSCKCFSFFISSCSSFAFRLCLSLFLVIEIHNFLEGIFRCLLYWLVELSERSFSCMFGLLVWSVLSVLLIPFVG